MTHPILEIQHLNHRFKKHQALKDISFSIKKSEIVGLIGRSGAGKSTLIRCLCALEKPTSGKVILDGIDLTQQPETRLIEIRRKIGLVFQHFNLLTSRTVAGNIALPLEISNMPKALRPARIKELLELVGLAGFEQKYPSQLSGGQKQRVGIARALAANPTLLLCDEATSALDPESTTSILNLLDDINRKLGLTIILITHEMDVVRRFAQRIIALDQGHLVEDGTLLNFLHDSGHKKTLQALLSDIRPHIPQEFKQALQADYSENALYIMRIVISQDIAYQPLFVTLYEKFAIKAMLLQGGITTMRDTILGDMIIGIQGQNLEAAKEYLEQISQSTEEIGYVPHHH